MKIFKISQNQNTDYDTYDSALVAAESKDDARTIHPDEDRYYDEDYNPWNNEIWNLWAIPRSAHNKIHKRILPHENKPLSRVKKPLSGPREWVPQHAQESARAAV